MTIRLIVSFYLGLMMAAPLAAQTAYTGPTARQAMVAWVQINSSPKASEKSAQQYVREVLRYSEQRKLDPLLVLAVMRHESYFNPKARSVAGAQGLMQVIPHWHKNKLKGRSLFNPEVAVDVGTEVLKECFDKYQGHTYKALGCYLGGKPSKYYKNIKVTHVAMSNAIKHQWFAQEQPFKDIPRVTVASVSLPPELLKTRSAIVVVSSTAPTDSLANFILRLH